MNQRRPVCGAPRQRGAAAIEFQIISIMVLIPMLLGVLQLGLMMVAKNTLNVAALATARAGAASGGDKDAMKHALMLGLVPLHTAEAKAMTGVGMSDITSGNYAGVMAAAMLKSKLANVEFSRITVLNPTSASFKDFGVDAYGRRTGIIPVTNVIGDTRVGAASKQTRADALLLKLEVRYCHVMEVPFIDDLIKKVMLDLLNDTPAADRYCYMRGRFPLKSQAVVRITVPINAKDFP